jgi:exonuclease SbcC
MKTTRIKIRNLFGIREFEIGGESIEITGTNGAGKTSVIEAIRLALTNDSSRDWIIKVGETEGEILIETDSGLRIDRKKRAEQADYKSVKENGKDVERPESFLRSIFTPLQLNPVEFVGMSRQEQNRIILDLIEFDWDMNWIKEQFGEIPQGVNYEQNILRVLHDIQAEDGVYFTERQDVNRDIRNKRAFIEDIAKDIPLNYQFKKWNEYNLAEKYHELETAREHNAKIEKAKAFKGSYNDKLRGLEAMRELALASEKDAIAKERERQTALIERLKAEIKAAQDTVKGLDGRLEDKKKVFDAQYEEQVAKLQKDVGAADEYMNLEPKDVMPLQEEITLAEAMKKHLNEFKRMKDMEVEVVDLKAVSEEYTRKIELARELPGEILKAAKIPVVGLTVKDGIPLINGLPISNLSDGEKLDLCVDVAIGKPATLQIILIDGAEKLSEKNRKRLYEKCKAKGLQFIATRTTDNDTMEVTDLCA